MPPGKISRNALVRQDSASDLLRIKTAIKNNSANIISMGSDILMQKRGATNWIADQRGCHPMFVALSRSVSATILTVVAKS